MEHEQKVTNINHAKFDIHTLDIMEVTRTFMFNLHMQTDREFVKRSRAFRGEPCWRAREGKGREPAQRKRAGKRARGSR